jgi:hypothetical protein
MSNKQRKHGIGKCNRIQTRRSLKIECFIFSVHTGLTHALSTALVETTWTGETAKLAQQHHYQQEEPENGLMVTFSGDGLNLKK